MSIGLKLSTRGSKWRHFTCQMYFRALNIFRLKVRQSHVSADFTFVRVTRTKKDRGTLISPSHILQTDGIIVQPDAQPAEKNRIVAAATILSRIGHATVSTSFRAYRVPGKC